MTQPTYLDRMDAFGRRHPRLMWAAIVVLSIVVALVFLVTTDTPAVLYQAF